MLLILLNNIIPLLHCVYYYLYMHMPLNQ